MAKIFVVEDDENIRELLLYALNSNGFDGVGFDCGRDFFANLKLGVPDLVFLDIMLPDEDGISILKKLKSDSRTAALPVIILTAKSSEYDMIKGLDCGADDYISKPFSVLELISRLKAVLRRANRGGERTHAAENIIQIGDIRLNISKHTVTANGIITTLTYKEFELLHLLMENKGIALSRDKIMERVWGFDFGGESRTVDVHIKTLRQKLGNSGKLIETVRGIGYRFGE